MKLQYRYTAVIVLIGIIVILFQSLWFNREYTNTEIDNQLNSIQTISEEVSHHLNSDICGKIGIANTLAATPIIKENLIKSNNDFSLMTKKQRDFKINALNKQWLKTTNITSPFIQSFLQNSVARYLKRQQVIMPNMYGELFLTNRYGVLVGASGKLTTLAHAHKYWWIASYDDGKGRVFLDDRGFDQSVDDYVLGVVIPIKDRDKIIGILKCNINIASCLTDAIKKYNQRSNGNLKIVRTGGLIIREPGKIPLSTQVSESIIDVLKENRILSTIISEEKTNKLAATAPVTITLGSKEIGFGGSKESIDHIKGNTGESWHIFITVPEEKVLKNAQKTTRKIIVAGAIFLLIISIIALILGQITAKPIANLVDKANKIGSGNFKTKIKGSSIDEINSLGTALNSMAKNLEKHISEKEKAIDNLQKALDEISTLRGIIPICSYCKKIRDDKGAWEIIESYISNHSEAQFSHGICPECYEKQMKELKKMD